MYPRTFLQRDNWHCLNGEWQFQIVSKKGLLHQHFELVNIPFMRLVKKTDTLYYRKTFNYHRFLDKTLLHFEGVRGKCHVYLNGSYLGEHLGGDSPFHFDVSELIQNNNELFIKFEQEQKNSFFATTSYKGVFGTVWLEDVKEDYVSNIFYVIDKENNRLIISLEGDFDQAIIMILRNNKLLKRDLVSDKVISYPLNEWEDWEIDNPVLYDVYVETNGDVIRSYFGVRTIEMNRRWLLNHHSIKINGVLAYPDMTYADLKQVKSLGFNTLLVTNEMFPSIFYTWCDHLGILVLFQISKIKSGANNRYYDQLNDMIITLFNHPSIIAWIGVVDSSIHHFIREIDAYRVVEGHIVVCTNQLKNSSNYKRISIYKKNIVPMTKKELMKVKQLNKKRRVL